MLGLVSQAGNPCGLTRTHLKRASPTLGLMLLKFCCRHLKILNKFVAILKFFITKDPHFHFERGLTNYIASPEYK